MPALRKSSRKSRTSTPYATPTHNQSPSEDDRGDKMQSSLDGWVEPPVKNPAPSFEDHGFARHGVLETMGALGVPPSQRVRMKVRAFPEAPTRRSTSGKNGNLLVPEEGALSTPEMTPAPEMGRDSERVDDDEVSAEPPTQDPDEDEDDDWVPKKSKGKAQVVKTPVRGKTPVQNKTPSQARTPQKNGTGPPSATMSSSANKAMGPLLGTDNGGAAAEQKIQIAVNDAVTRARAHNQLAIIAALRQLYENARSDRAIHAVLEGMIYQSASPEQHERFRRFIKEEKKRHRRSSRAADTGGAREAIHSDGASNLHSEPMSPSFSPLPAKATNGDSPTKSAERFLTRKSVSGLPAQPSDPMDISPDYTPPVGQDQTVSSGSAQAHPLSTIPTLAKRSPSPGKRMPSKSPRKNGTSNGSAAVETDAAREVSPLNATTPDSILGPNSDSDLSDVNEEIVQNGPPVSPKKTNGSAVAPASGPKKTLPAPVRTGKKPRANSAKPNGRFEKKAPPTAEEIAQEAEIVRRREQMAEQQPVRSYYNPPVSDMRFEDEMLETESLTESQIAVGPPIDSNRPRRTGRGPRGNLNLNVGKRMREDSQALSSPLPPISATSTRPTTPAFAPPPAKRLKLTNNSGAARTKRSPVKNRDGPIAGIAHAGGGSRQLGPDDNDPGSPPSESDDFCSACKGAGEFVCCDTCPRVYHFLCCDPPRLEPPPGSFLCHECTEKAPPAADAPVVDRFTVFGPLIKKLDATNPRSFALPPDIQDYFEGVTARDDGSYGEEVKKFPLSKSSGYGYQKPDYLRTHDAEHRQILCVQCGTSAAGKRQMLKCDYCDAYWHLDCCDPPLANPPPINLETANRDAWKCPRHVDHDLRSGLLLPNDLRLHVRGDDVDMLDAPARHQVPRKIRKPKRPSVAEPLFSRGMRNNGLIEVINDDADETDGEGNYVFPSDDPNSKVYRIPEKGIILDFFHKVNSDRVQKHHQEHRATKAARARSAYQNQFAARPIEQQQTALHLAQLANKEKDVGLNEQSVSALYLSLTAEAPEDVVSALSKQEASATAEAKRAELLKLKELIERALAA